MTTTEALQIARDALEEIALAGMSGSGQESEEGMRDWHARRAWDFIAIAARAKMAVDEAVAALAAAAPSPIDMVLRCPACGLQHIDAPSHTHNDQGADVWTNPPHRSHLCHGCGHIWRPADVPTNGVQAVKTKGKNDSTAPMINGLTASETPIAGLGRITFEDETHELLLGFKDDESMRAYGATLGLTVDVNDMPRLASETDETALVVNINPAPNASAPHVPSPSVNVSLVGHIPRSEFTDNTFTHGIATNTRGEVPAEPSVCAHGIRAPHECRDCSEAQAVGEVRRAPPDKRGRIVGANVAELFLGAAVRPGDKLYTTARAPDAQADTAIIRAARNIQHSLFHDGPGDAVLALRDQLLPLLAGALEDCGYLPDLQRAARDA